MKFSYLFQPFLFDIFRQIHKKYSGLARDFTNIYKTVIKSIQTRNNSLWITECYSIEVLKPTILNVIESVKAPALTITPTKQ